jgi:His-Xaa-Ser system protein HxsD
MTAADVPGIPPEIAKLDLDEESVRVELDATLYPLDAVYGAAYVFIDRCYVLLDRPAPDRFRITLSPKTGPTDASALRAMVGELANELLSCAWRLRITQENRALIESVTMRAIAGAMGPPSLDDLESFDFSAEAFEDPLGIAMSWEEKYGKNKKKEKEEGSA